MTVVGAVGLSTSLTAQTPMTEVRGDGFVLRGALSPDKLAVVACDLERAARALRLPHHTMSTPRVVAVENARGIREWLPPSTEGKATNPLGAYWRGLYGHHIVVRVDARPEERFRRILHEFAHYTTHLIHPEPPRWLDEGLSELWEHAAITPSAVEVGRPVADHLRRLRSGKDWIPVQDLIAVNAVPAANASRTAMFYAQSWALGHYLMARQSGARVVPDRVPDAKDLPTDDALKAYIQGPMAGRVTLSTVAGSNNECSRPAAVRTMPPLELVINRAQALADSDRAEAALPLLHEVLKHDSGNAEALEALGFVHFTGNRPVEAAATFDAVIAAGKGSHISFYYRAVLAGPVPGRSDGQGVIPQVEYLRRAVALNPGFAPATERLKELSGKGLTLAPPPRL